MNRSTGESSTYIIIKERLEPGDVILTRDSQKLSKLIRVATAGSYSHAILYVGGASYIDSSRAGVHSNNIQRLLFATEADCKVLRFKHKLPSSITDSITAFARHRVGTSYTIKDAVRSGPVPNLSKQIEENRQFCSRLVAQAYNSVGIALTSNPDLSSPEAINKSPQLIEIKNCLREATDQEVEFAADDVNNPLATQTESTNYILREVRRISGVDIQTLDQVSILSLFRPDLDDKIVDVVSKSGYLELWKLDVEKNPWRYNYEEFVATFPEAQQYEAANEEREREPEMRERYQSNLEAFKDMHQDHPRKSTKQMIDLYEQLMLVSDWRTAVFTKALNQNLDRKSV